MELSALSAASAVIFLLAALSCAAEMIALYYAYHAARR